MMAKTKIGDALEKAFEEKANLMQTDGSKDVRSNKEKYLDESKGLSENERAVKFGVYIMNMLNDTLYDINVKGLKDVLKYKMENGVYKAVIKEKKDNGYIVSVGRAKIEGDVGGEDEDVTLDYFVGNKKIDQSLQKGDSLFVNLNLDKNKEKLDIEEVRLEQGQTCLVKLTNVGPKGAYIRTGKYEGFIDKKQLEQIKVEKPLKSGDKVLLEINNIKVNDKNKDKLWIYRDVPSQEQKEKIVVDLYKFWKLEESISLAA